MFWLKCLIDNTILQKSFLLSKKEFNKMNRDFYKIVYNETTLRKQIHAISFNNIHSYLLLNITKSSLSQAELKNVLKTIYKL